MAKKRKTKPEPGQSKKETRRQRAVANKKAANAKILIALGSAVIFIALLWAVFGNTATLQEWDVDEDGIMSYPTDRKIPVYDSMIVEYPGYFLDYINYSSRDAVISALLRIPNSSHPVPGILILPGATVSKEGEQVLSAELAEWDMLPWSLTSATWEEWTSSLTAGCSRPGMNLTSIKWSLMP